MDVDDNEMNSEPDAKELDTNDQEFTNEDLLDLINAFSQEEKEKNKQAKVNIPNLNEISKKSENYDYQPKMKKSVKFRRKKEFNPIDEIDFRVEL